MMVNRRVVPMICVIVLMCLGAAAADDGKHLVLRDGSSIVVEQATVRSGAVVVQLPNGRFQQYEVADVDLVASGLADTPARAPAESARTGLGGGGRLGQAMAADSEPSSVVTITDDDVAHVDRTARPIADEDDGDEATEEVDSGEGALRISSVSQVVGDGQVTVSGQVVNDGVNELLDVTVSIGVVDIEGERIGEGTVGISRTLASGAAQGFSLVVPVTGEAANVQVSGRGTAMVRPSAVAADEGGASPEQPESEDEDGSQGGDDS
jgi:hypothetical protein